MTWLQAYGKKPPLGTHCQSGCLESRSFYHSDIRWACLCAARTAWYSYMLVCVFVRQLSIKWNLWASGKTELLLPLFRNVSSFIHVERLCFCDHISFSFSLKNGVFVLVQGLPSVSHCQRVHWYDINRYLVRLSFFSWKYCSSCVTAYIAFPPVNLLQYIHKLISLVRMWSRLLSLNVGCRFHVVYVGQLFIASPWGYYARNCCSLNFLALSDRRATNPTKFAMFQIIVYAHWII